MNLFNYATVLLSSLKRIFVGSTAVHLSEDPAETTDEFVDLADRFISDQLRYDMEWDDFISWPSVNLHLEVVRQRLGDVERLLFSSIAEDRERYANAC